MKEKFGYCIWLLPEENHIWYKYTKDFLPHITLFYYLSKEEAIQKIKELKKQKKQSIKVYLEGECKQNKTNNFYSLFYKVIPTNKNTIPKWWPENAHISFRYQYDKSFTKKEIEEINELIKETSAKLDKFAIYKCDGHYKNWKEEIKYL